MLFQNILSFRLSPYTNPFLQPHDVVYFELLKNYDAEDVYNAVRTEDTEFTRVEFLAHIQSIRKQTFKSQ